MRSAEWPVCDERHRSSRRRYRLVSVINRPFRGRVIGGVYSRRESLSEIPQLLRQIRKQRLRIKAVLVDEPLNVRN